MNETKNILLERALIRKNEDYSPYGQHERSQNDCSCGCDYFINLSGEFGKDWGVCTNSNSHRCGLLTFEHQGCSNFSRKGESR